jgi:hypothetical protein
LEFRGSIIGNEGAVIVAKLSGLAIQGSKPSCIGFLVQLYRVLSLVVQGYLLPSTALQVCGSPLDSEHRL